MTSYEQISTQYPKIANLIDDFDLMYSLANWVEKNLPKSIKQSSLDIDKKVELLGVLKKHSDLVKRLFAFRGQSFKYASAKIVEESE